MIFERLRRFLCAGHCEGIGHLIALGIVLARLRWLGMGLETVFGGIAGCIAAQRSAYCCRSAWYGVVVHHGAYCRSAWSGMAWYCAVCVHGIHCFCRLVIFLGDCAAMACDATAGWWRCRFAECRMQIPGSGFRIASHRRSAFVWIRISQLSVYISPLALYHTVFTCS